MPGGPVLAGLGSGVASVCMVLSGIMLVAIVVINGVNVFARYVLFSALSWAEEAMVFLMICSVFLGAIAVTWEQAHIRIDALIHALSPRRRVLLEVIGLLTAAVVLVPVGFFSLEVVGMLKSFDQRSEALHFPVWIPQATLPLMLLAVPLLMAMALVRNRGRGSSVHGGQDPNPTTEASGSADARAGQDDKAGS
jgi:TRAP-type C4-dicarboxylate transport system permease small subunit